MTRARRIFRILEKTTQDRLLNILDKVAAETGIGVSGETGLDVLPNSDWSEYEQSNDVILIGSKILKGPEAEANYTLLHELAHSVSLNHDKAFYQALDRLLHAAKKLNIPISKGKGYR